MTLGYDFAVVNDIGFVCDFERSLDVVVGNQNTNARCDQSFYFSLQFLNRNRVNPAEWFIEQNQRWVCYHCTGDFEFSPFSAGQKSGLTV